MTQTVHEIRRAVMAMGNGKFGGDAKLPAEYWKALMGDQLLLGYLVEVTDVYWKSGSYPESVATFTHAGPTLTELTTRAKLAKAKVNGWRISWLQENPKSVGSASRTRYERYKGTATIAVMRARHFGRSWASFDHSENSIGRLACLSHRSRERS